ncbi:hypothetical protein [Aquibium microcysteis]|uniref:hypothetical protein n=1 Tax=Aquibium microcysteis TaxID=675281 RepID=UPI00165CFF3D|nr:hypothetical protein [Aquibium microcysteis]
MDEPHRVAFDFHGAGLVAEAPRRSWTAGMEDSFRWYVTETPPEPAFRLTMHEDEDPRMPPDMPLTWSGLLPEREPGRMYETDTLWALEVGTHGFLRIDHTASTAELVMRRGSERAFTMTPIVAVLSAALHARGQHIVHGASLGCRDGRGAILICAPSGFGKTTTSLALAREGFRLFADDVSMIVSGTEASKPRIWGLPNWLRIHRKTLELLPWLGPLPDKWNAEDEQAVALHDMDAILPVGRTAPAPLRAVIIIGTRAERHSVVPLARAEALVRLARDNVSSSGAGVTPWHRRQFAAYADALKSCPVFELHAGTDLASLADEVDAALAAAER